MLLAFLLWLAATVVAFHVCQFTYVYLQAVVGRWAGATPKEVCVGIGPQLARFQRRGVPIIFKLLPISAYTKFYGWDEDEEVESPAEIAAALSATRWPEIPVHGRILTLLTGPCSSIVLGVLCLAAPVLLQRPHLYRDSSAASDFRWSAVPGLRASAEPATPDTQIALIDQTVLEFFRRLFTWQSLDGWGGILGTFVTIASTGTTDFGHWLSCLGVLFTVGGCINLLPLPIMNGGHIVIMCLEWLRGRPLAESTLMRLGGPTIVLYLAVMLLLVLQDIRWFRVL